MKISRFIFRMWYYFRVGYNIYLSFLLGFATTVVTIYYLAITNIPILQNVFPHFWIFTTVAFSLGVPIACFIGWLHIKGSAIWKSEVDVTVEANPYSYRLAPGKEIEAYVPLYLELLKGVKKMLEREGILGEEERKRIEDLEAKLGTLIKGGALGKPRTRAKLNSPES